MNNDILDARNAYQTNSSRYNYDTDACPPQHNAHQLTCHTVRSDYTSSIYLYLTPHFNAIKYDGYFLKLEKRAAWGAEDTSHE
ncbi:hypothetical protein HNQ57_001916 [Zhongshania antarctica]|uniref:Uncharacterized protein n=1 Tax=Zhongshania antarctica TaxID=641702 RepID=A0A840R4W7_9GAMM|nr:hypothetical protein [Zhongshania antarctica]